MNSNFPFEEKLLTDLLLTVKEEKKKKNSELLQMFFFTSTLVSFGHEFPFHFSRYYQSWLSGAIRTFAAGRVTLCTFLLLNFELDFSSFQSNLVFLSKHTDTIL